MQHPSKPVASSTRFRTRSEACLSTVIVVFMAAAVGVVGAVLLLAYIEAQDEPFTAVKIEGRTPASELPDRRVCLWSNDVNSTLFFGVSLTVSRSSPSKILVDVVHDAWQTQLITGLRVPDSAQSELPRYPLDQALFPLPLGQNNMTRIKATVLAALDASPVMVEVKALLAGVPAGEWQERFQKGHTKDSSSNFLSPPTRVCYHPENPDATDGWGRSDALGGRQMLVFFSSADLNHSVITRTYDGSAFGSLHTSRLLSEPRVQTLIKDPRISSLAIRSQSQPATSLAAIRYDLTVVPEGQKTSRDFVTGGDSLDVQCPCSIYTVAQDVTPIALNESVLRRALDIDGLVAAAGIDGPNSQRQVAATVLTFQPTHPHFQTLNVVPSYTALQLAADFFGAVSIVTTLYGLLFPLSSRFTRALRRCCKGPSSSSSSSGSGPDTLESAMKKEREAGGSERALSKTYTIHEAPAQRSVTLFQDKYQSQWDAIVAILFVVAAVAFLAFQAYSFLERVADQEAKPSTIFSWLPRNRRTGGPMPTIVMCGQSGVVPSAIALYTDTSGNIAVDLIVNRFAVAGALSPPPLWEEYEQYELRSIVREMLVEIVGNGQLADAVMPGIKTNFVPEAVFNYTEPFFLSAGEQRQCAVVNLQGNIGIFEKSIIGGQVYIVVISARPADGSTVGFQLDSGSIRTSAIDSRSVPADRTTLGEYVGGLTYVITAENGHHQLSFDTSEYVWRNGTSELTYAIGATEQSEKLGLGIDESRFTSLLNMTKNDTVYHGSLLEVVSNSDFYLRTEQRIFYTYWSAIADFGGSIAFVSGLFVLLFPLTKTPRREGRVLHVVSCGYYAPEKADQGQRADIAVAQAPSCWARWRQRFPYGQDAVAALFFATVLILGAVAQTYVLTVQLRDAASEPITSDEAVVRAGGEPVPAVRLCTDAAAGMRWSVVSLGMGASPGAPAIDMNVDSAAVPDLSDEAKIIENIKEGALAIGGEKYRDIVNVVNSLKRYNSSGDRFTLSTSSGDKQCVVVNAGGQLRAWTAGDLMEGKFWLASILVVPKAAGPRPSLLEVQLLNPASSRRELQCTSECGTAPNIFPPEGAVTLTYYPLVVEDINGHTRTSFASVTSGHPASNVNLTRIAAVQNVPPESVDDYHVLPLQFIIGSSGDTYRRHTESLSYNLLSWVSDVGAVWGVTFTVFGLLFPMLVVYTRSSRLHTCLTVATGHGRDGRGHDGSDDDDDNEENEQGVELGLASPSSMTIPVKTVQNTDTVM